MAVEAPIVLGPDEGLTHTPHKFGLFSAVKPTAAYGGRWGMGVTINDLCGVDAPDAQDVQCLPGGTDIDWDAIVQDSGIGGDIEAKEMVLPIKCKMVGMEDTKAKAVSLFARVEQNGYERILATDAYAGGTGVGGADVANVETALATALQAWYVDNGEQAIVHASPAVATMLGSHVVNRTDHAELRTGERLVIGGGYSLTGQPNTLFVTGDLLAFEGPKATIEVPNYTNNDYVVIVRKTVLVGSQCPAIFVDIADTGLTG